MLSDALLQEAGALLDACRSKSIRLATAESCTGGLLAAALTDGAGASDVFDRGFVTYSNRAKHDLLGVPSELIAEHGAVSRDVACAMAEGALRNADAAIAVSITGVAGPNGGTADKPVGVVCFGLAQIGVAVVSEQHIFSGDRAAVRSAAVAHAIAMIRART